MNEYKDRILNGIIKENPTFILILGMCPTLAVTTSAMNGVGMGLSTTAVLIFSNLLISLLRNIIPDKVRIPAYIVVIASLVTVVELVLKAYIPALYSALGLYIPLIVVNCIILGRAEAYASKSTPVLAVCDGIGMGLGFTIALTLIGILRELIGAGSFFGMNIMPSAYQPVAIFVKAPGAFIVLGGIIAVMNGLKIKNNSSKKVEGCSGDCCSCGSSDCSDAKKKK
ncbi:MAG: electron transport complex subunit E [Blautia sp.]|nr:electron transport complex subunit E [Blautia sp.]MDY5031614.1 electron transport complex subunit E [Blautia sp.]